MGEEKKNPEGKAEEDPKKVPEAENKQKEETPPPPSPPPPSAEDTKSAGDKKSDDSKPDAPPPPPPEIVMRVYMHCEGCARKVRRCLKGFPGVEEVITDCKSHKVVVKGEKADPLKVVDRVQKKTHRQVELLSPIPQPSPPEEKKAEEKEAPKPEEKKDEPKVVTVVLKVHMHCEACALEIKKRIERMKEVEEATPDLKNSQVSVKGTFDPPKLVEYVYKRTGKHAILLKQDPPPETKEEDKGKDGKEEKKGDEGNKGEDQKGGADGKGDKPEDAGKETAPDGGAVAEAGEEVGKMEFKRSEYYYNYPPRYTMEMYPYPPQIFSDENPNACFIM